jgi:hypothetical protein
MTSFEESLKAAIQGINSNLEVVENDLHEVVTEAASGIQHVSKGRAQLALSKMAETPDFVQYVLQLVSKVTQPVQLLQFNISRKGYPITGSHGLNIQNKEELKKVIADMGTNPDSPLVVHLAYILRRMGNTPA